MRRSLLLSACIVTALGQAFAGHGHYHFAKYNPTQHIPCDIYLSSWYASDEISNLDDIILNFVKDHPNSVAIYHGDLHLNFAAKLYDNLNHEYYYGVIETSYAYGIPNGVYYIYTDYVAENPDLDYYYMVDEDYVWDNAEDKLYGGFSRFSPQVDWIPLDIHHATTDEDQQKCQAACHALVEKFHDVYAIYKTNVESSSVSACWYDYYNEEIVEDEMYLDDLTGSWNRNDRLRFYYIQNAANLYDPDDQGITPDVDGAEINDSTDPVDTAISVTQDNAPVMITHKCIDANGRIVIMQGGKSYNAMGQRLR